MRDNGQKEVSDNTNYLGINLLKHFFFVTNSDSK